MNSGGYGSRAFGETSSEFSQYARRLRIGGITSGTSRASSSEMCGVGVGTMGYSVGTGGSGSSGACCL